MQVKLGAATETVEVTAAPPLLQTADASVGQVVTERTVNDLPLNGRNFTFLAQIGAGTQTPQADTRGNAASGAFTANGLRPAQNNYLLDGIDNNSNAVDFLNGTNFIVLPPVDAISEFKVQTANSAPNSDVRLAQFSMPPSSLVPIIFTDPPGSSSATTYWMPPIGSRTMAELKRVPCVRISSAAPSEVRSEETRPSSSATTKACGVCRAQ